VLESTLDDPPQAARKLFEIIKCYVHRRSVDNTIPKKKVIFERKDIREFSSWSFAQVRSNFRIVEHLRENGIPILSVKEGSHGGRRAGQKWQGSARFRTSCSNVNDWRGPNIIN
jgi:hypothetical protein